MIAIALILLEAGMAPAAAPAWRPFLDPLDLHGQWLALLPPLVIAISLVYKTLKMPTLDGLAIETLRLSAYILLIMAVAALALYLLVELVA